MKGAIEEFNYPRKGKNIPPPKLTEEMMMEGEEGQYIDENELQLYDENGQPRKFYDDEGNEIPFEEVKQQLMMMQ